MKQNRERTELISAGKKILILLMLIYLLNLGAGVVEVAPDNIPILGNLDEVVATVIAYKLYESL